jgi:hypothetical protein
MMFTCDVMTFTADRYYSHQVNAVVGVVRCYRG